MFDDLPRFCKGFYICNNADIESNPKSQNSNKTISPNLAEPEHAAIRNLTIQALLCNVTKYLY